jgi:Polyketide cyclase / dehydrase and lipid transport
MRWVLIVAGSLIGLVLLVVAVGLALPRNHRATSRIRLPQAPDSVWAAIRDIGQVAGWWPEVKRVERLEDAGGKERWRESLRGDMALVLLVAEENAPTRLRMVIEDSGAPFGGEWVYRITPEGEGCVLEVTEDGWVSNPVFRVVSRFMGQHRTMDGYLSALARRFGASSRPEHVS